MVLALDTPHLGAKRFDLVQQTQYDFNARSVQADIGLQAANLAQARQLRLTQEWYPILFRRGRHQASLKTASDLHRAHPDELSSHLDPVKADAFGASVHVQSLQRLLLHKAPRTLAVEPPTPPGLLDAGRLAAEAAQLLDELTLTARQTLGHLDVNLGVEVTVLAGRVQLGHTLTP